MHHHVCFGLAGARGSENSRALYFHHAYPAHVDRRQALQVAKGRRVDPERPAGLQDGGAFRDANALSIDGELDQASGRANGNGAHDLALPPNAPSLAIADLTALDAVCPSPQMEASCMAWPISDRILRSSSREPNGWPRRRRCSTSSCRTVPTRQGTHCPQD